MDLDSPYITLYFFLRCSSKPNCPSKQRSRGGCKTEEIGGRRFKAERMVAAEGRDGGSAGSNARTSNKLLSSTLSYPPFATALCSDRLMYCSDL